MVKYSAEPKDAESSVKAKGNDLKVHFKNVVNVAAAVQGMRLERALAYLKNVLDHKEAVAVQSHKGGRGRHSQVSP